uniref:Uncharacterized protein n=1 Tax=Anguilla anguilla TaxID=7936 RepID=A0A0E9WK01_ANGAN
MFQKNYLVFIRSIANSVFSQNSALN